MRQHDCLKRNHSFFHLITGSEATYYSVIKSTILETLFAEEIGQKNLPRQDLELKRGTKLQKY